MTFALCHAFPLPSPCVRWDTWRGGTHSTIYLRWGTESPCVPHHFNHWSRGWLSWWLCCSLFYLSVILTSPFCLSLYKSASSVLSVTCFLLHAWSLIADLLNMLDGFDLSTPVKTPVMLSTSVWCYIQVVFQFLHCYNDRSSHHQGICPCRLWGANVSGFMSWLGHCINCSFVYSTSFLFSPIIIYFFTYL